MHVVATSVSVVELLEPAGLDVVEASDSFVKLPLVESCVFDLVALSDSGVRVELLCPLMLMW